jgi:lipoate-protein ligase A
MNMAMDEAILRARIRNLTPNTLRFYRWRPSAVSIGRYQDMQKEAQMDNCRKHGVDVVRRITGGGAVYHDAEDEITYSLIARKDELGTQDITGVYRKIYNGLAEAVGILGGDADFNQGTAKMCPNLTVNGKKISGSAQAHKSGVVLQHGTILLRANLERMFTFLQVPWAATTAQVMDIARKRITSLCTELGRHVAVTEANDAMVKGFEKALKTKLAPSKLSAVELQLSENLHRQKYVTDGWNLFGETNDQRKEDFFCEKHVLLKLKRKAARNGESVNSDS